MWINIFTVVIFAKKYRYSMTQNSNIPHNLETLIVFSQILHKHIVVVLRLCIPVFVTSHFCPTTINESIISTKSVEHNSILRQETKKKVAVYVSPPSGWAAACGNKKKIVLVSFECHHHRKENAKSLSCLYALEPTRIS